MYRFDFDFVEASFYAELYNVFAAPCSGIFEGIFEGPPGNQNKVIRVYVSSIGCFTWVFPKIMVPQNEWVIMENPIKMNDLGIPLFLETPTL